MILMGNRSYYEIKQEAENARIREQDSRRHREGSADQADSLPLEYYPQGGGRRKGEILPNFISAERQHPSEGTANVVSGPSAQKAV